MNLEHVTHTVVRTAQEQTVLTWAKRRLFRVFRWDEPMAHRRLQQAAMNRRVKMVDLAETVLKRHLFEVRDIFRRWWDE